MKQEVGHKKSVKMIAIGWDYYMREGIVTAV
jgi:hypothetical protein